MALLAGQAVGLVNEIKPAATVVRELADGASHLIEQRLGSLVSIQGVVGAHLLRLRCW
jgi:hypothetical protein